MSLFMSWPRSQEPLRLLRSHERQVAEAYLQSVAPDGGQGKELLGVF